MKNLEEKVNSPDWYVRRIVVRTGWADLTPEQRNTLAADPDWYVRRIVVETGWADLTPEQRKEAQS